MVQELDLHRIIPTIGPRIGPPTQLVQELDHQPEFQPKLEQTNDLHTIRNSIVNFGRFAK